MKFSVVIENAKKIIKSKGLKQKYVAKRANFSECQFSDLLNGRKKIDDSVVISLCNALEVTPNELFGYQCKENK